MSKVSHISEVMPDLVEVLQARCAHVWPAELSPDAPCEHGCGLTYDNWAEKADA